MSRLKTLVRNQDGIPPLRGGHSLCQGCGVPLVVRTVLSTITQPVIVVNATGCLEVATTRYPTTAWNVPWLHVAFENAAAVASGVESAQRALRRRHALPADEEVAVVVFAGDGGTYDIGLQALSGALERGHRFLFVCYDNEAYMNTGVQRSGATPFAASTTTSPAGSRELGQGAAAEGHDGHRRRPPRPVRRSGRRDPLARPERQGRARCRRAGPGLPQRAHRLPRRLGARAAALRPGDRHRRGLPLLAALRGGRRELSPDPCAREARAGRGLARAPGTLRASPPARQRAVVDEIQAQVEATGRRSSNAAVDGDTARRTAVPVGGARRTPARRHRPQGGCGRRGEGRRCRRSACSSSPSWRERSSRSARSSRRPSTAGGSDCRTA